MKIRAYTKQEAAPGEIAHIRGTTHREIVILAIESDPYHATEIQGGKIGSVDLDRARFAVIRDRPSRVSALESPITLAIGESFEIVAKNIKAHPDHIGCTLIAMTPEDFARARRFL